MMRLPLHQQATAASYRGSSNKTSSSRAPHHDGRTLMHSQRRTTARAMAECSTPSGSVLSQTLLFGLLLQVVLAVLLVHSLNERNPTTVGNIPINNNGNSNSLQELQQMQSLSPATSIILAKKSHHPYLSGLIRSYTTGDHDPIQSRNTITFTTVPSEIPLLTLVVRQVLQYMDQDTAQTFHAIHLCIPDRPMRFQDTFSSTEQLRANFTDPRIIIHRLPDYGPMTRYLGPLSYEQNEDTTVTLFDMDSVDLTYDLTWGNANESNVTRDIVHLVHAARHIDTRAIWCNQGENFAMNEFGQVKPVWDLYPEQQAPGNFTWNEVHFCRGVGGLLFKPRHFENFWYNQSDYHESCFWDDDRWVSYQMERQGFPLKVLHNPKRGVDPKAVVADVATATTNDAMDSNAHRRLGTLTNVNLGLGSAEACPIKWLTQHPETYPSARIHSGSPWLVEVPAPPPPPELLLKNHAFFEAAAAAAAKNGLASNTSTAAAGDMSPGVASILNLTQLQTFGTKPGAGAAISSTATAAGALRAGGGHLMSSSTL